MKYRNFSCVLYGSLENLDEFLNTAETIPRAYAYIVHDKDILDNGEPKKTHIHLILSYSNARSIENVEKILLVYMNKNELQHQNVFIEPCRNIKSAFDYLTHKNDKNKYQYTIDNVVCSSIEFFQHQSSTNDYISHVLDFIEGCDRFVSYTELLRHFGNILSMCRVNWIYVLKEHNDSYVLMKDLCKTKSELYDVKVHNKQLQSDLLDLVMEGKENE